MPFFGLAATFSRSTGSTSSQLIIRKISRLRIAQWALPVSPKIVPNRTGLQQYGSAARQVEKAHELGGVFGKLPATTARLTDWAPPITRASTAAIISELKLRIHEEARDQQSNPDRQIDMQGRFGTDPIDSLPTSSAGNETNCTIRISIDNSPTSIFRTLSARDQA